MSIYASPSKIEVEKFLRKSTNAFNHFMNQQIYDCVEVVEDKPQSDLAISTYGEIKQYQDGTREFYWKEKLMLVCRLGKDEWNNIIAYADLIYMDEQLTLQEYDQRADQ